MSFRVLTVLIAALLPIVSVRSQQTSAELQSVYRLTRSAQTEKDYNGIVIACEKALTTSRTATDRRYARQLLAWALNRRGELRWDEGDSDTDRQHGIADMRRAVELDPSRWRAIQNLAIVAAEEEDYEAALSYLDRVVSLQPKYAVAYLNRAEIQFELGDVEAAIADYVQARQLDPSDATVLNGLGHAHFVAGDWEAARASFAAAVDKQPQNVEFQCDLADLLQLGRDWAGAEQHYRSALRLDQDNRKVLVRLAWLLATCPDDAIRATVQARQLMADIAPSSPLAFEVAAALAAEGDDFERAVMLQRQAIAAHQDERRESARYRLEQYRAGRKYRQGDESDAAARTARLDSGGEDGPALPKK